MGRWRWTLVCWFGLAASASAAPLRLCYEDVPQPPWTMPDGTGLNLTLLKLVEHAAGEQFQLFVKPWKRCIEELKGGQMDALVGAADTPERRAFLVPPVLADGRANPDAALNQDQVYVFLRVGGKATWNGKDLVTPHNEVVAQRGYMVADVLRQRGYTVIDAVKSAEDGLRMLAAGAADAAVLEGLAAHSLARNDARFKGKVTEARPPYMVMSAYLSFSRLAYQREPSRIEAIWSALSTVRSNPDYQRMVNERLALPE
jgi:polar amino acid transport system substrate-binding protein